MVRTLCFFLQGAWVHVLGKEIQDLANLSWGERHKVDQGCDESDAEDQSEGNADKREGVRDR